MNETIWLQEVVENARHEWIFDSKFYCELNSIELLWAHVKRYLRSKFSFSYPDLQARLPTAGSQRRTDSIFKRVSRHCFRCIQAYCDKLVGPLLGYAMAAQIFCPPSDPARPFGCCQKGIRANSVTLEHDNVVHNIISDFLSCLVLLAYVKPQFL